MHIGCGSKLVISNKKTVYKNVKREIKIQLWIYVFEIFLFSMARLLPMLKWIKSTITLYFEFSVWKRKLFKWYKVNYSFNYLCNESISHWSHFIYRPIFKIVSPYFVTLLLQQAIGISYLRLAVYRLGVNLISNLIWRPGNFKDLNTKLTKCIT